MNDILKNLFSGSKEKISESSDTAQLVWLKPPVLAQIVESCRTVMANTSKEEELEPLVEASVRIFDAVLYINGKKLLILVLHFFELLTLCNRYCLFCVYSQQPV